MDMPDLAGVASVSDMKQGWPHGMNELFVRAAM
jgi:hypothetical protein